MSYEIEEFITDAIIIAKVKNGGDRVSPLPRYVMSMEFLPKFSEVLGL
jgi:hypothetical protein